MKRLIAFENLSVSQMLLTSSHLLFVLQIVKAFLVFRLESRTTFSKGIVISFILVFSPALVRLVTRK